MAIEQPIKYTGHYLVFSLIKETWWDFSNEMPWDKLADQNQECDV